MKKLLIVSMICTMLLYSCNKATSVNTSVEEQKVLNDFVGTIVLPQYQNLQSKSQIFYNSVRLLDSVTTDNNLLAAREAWRDMRAGWEQCEGFLLGPVEDDNYDPTMDTWPVDNVQLDSLMNSSNALTLTDIQNLSTLSLKGFHPIEYILWGKDGNASAANITSRKKKYMVSLSADIVHVTTQLNSSWSAGGGNFQQHILQAGTANSRYKSKQEAFLAIATALVDICGEVAESKMGEPYIQRDSTLSESRFSHNSMSDFRNNIIGAQNVYLCNYQSQGESLSKLVAAKNTSLDNQIRQQFTAAIHSFDNVSVPFETAIFTQRVQLQSIITAITTLQQTLDGQLKPFIQEKIKD